MPTTGELLSGNAIPLSYVDLERNRRLRLGRLICLASMGVLLLAVPMLLLRYHFTPDAIPAEFRILNFSFIALAFVFFVGCYILIQRQQLGVALVSIILTPLVAATGYQVIAVIQFGMTSIVTSVFGAYLIMIAFAGILGNVRLILVSLALAVGITLGLCLLLPQPHFELGHSLTLCFSLLIQQFVMALITLAASITIHQTISELSTTRDAYQHALQLNEVKDQFLNIVNHELRNTLAALLPNLELVQMNAARMPHDDIVAAVIKANAAGESLREQLASILDIRQLDLSATDFRWEVVNARKAIMRAAELVAQGEAGSKQHPLRIDAPADVVIWGERVRLQQIMFNLISNAVKYSPAGTLIEIAAVTRPDGMVEITVRDHGLGIPPDQQDLLFKSFSRLERDRTSAVKGSGLGLYLCRILAQAMGGSIRLESSGTPGEGTTFHLLLPAPSLEQISAETAQASH